MNNDDSSFCLLFMCLGVIYIRVSLRAGACEDAALHQQPLAAGLWLTASALALIREIVFGWGTPDSGTLHLQLV
jgi:hypothetical protein